ncbi:inositol monophosphatase family protein [Gordonia sp. TBRC 11910]|uniref:inositol-phosphate phosphatase n=1 Tax=Gordonia asplenii TaxID=2725283 RepID=A0A848L5D3_9ACTN|nr:inositol monophosphatase family protein [Gordonia asplenii]NMO04235.1 inositol monophosphatase family protein [Gordonia asplenii]
MGTASAVLDSVVDIFVDGLGAPSAVAKGRNDFATQVDLDLERLISSRLTELTGLPVHGEEFGGPDVESSTVWVLDPIDGTFNYSSGMPLTGMLLSLVSDGQPLIGMTWLPLLGRRYCAYDGSPLYCNGQELPTLPVDEDLASSVLAYGAFNAKAKGRYFGTRRIDLLTELSSRVSRIRMLGSTGVDLAYTAAGVFGGAITFGGHPWDNAAGALLVRAAGGVISDLDGNPWSVSSPSIVAGSPGLHAQLLALIEEFIAGNWKEEQ